MVLCELENYNSQSDSEAEPDISLEAGGVSNTELMITVMDMETSYVIVVNNNDVSFTTSALTAISHPRHLIRGWRESKDLTGVFILTSLD